MRPTRRLLSSLCFGSLALLGCGSGGGLGGDDAPPGPDGGGDPPLCADPDPEEPGNGEDDDCDGLVDEVSVCGTGDADHRTIGAAVEAAADGTGIEVCAGTFTERFVVSGKRIAIHGAGRDATIIDGAGAGTVVAVRPGSGLTLKGVTLQRGTSAAAGGNLSCDGSALTLDRVAVLDGRAEMGGGGVHARGCTLDVKGSLFARNHGSIANGGGLALIDSTGTIADSELTGNHGEWGGAIAITGGAITVRGSQLNGNTAGVRGGALYLAADAVIEDNEITGNASGWIGGAIYLDRHAPTLSRNNIDDNDAMEEAGGIYLHQSAATLTENRITNNTCTDDGGGLRIFESPATLTRNVISGNRAESDGGGMKISHVKATLIDNEITDNWAQWGGGGIEMDNDSSVLRGGLIARNESGVGGGVHIMLWAHTHGIVEDVRIEDNKAVRGAGMLIHDNYHPVRLRRVTIKGNVATGDGAGIWTRSTPLDLTNTILSGNRAGGPGGALYVGPLDEPWNVQNYPPPPVNPPVRFALSTIHANQAREGSGLWVSVPNVAVESSIFDGNTGTAVMTQSGAQPTWRYTTAMPATFAGMFDPSGRDGNLSVACGFVDAGGGDFHLAAGSACIDAGDPGLQDRDGSRADMGAFAGPDSPQ